MRMRLMLLVALGALYIGMGGDAVAKRESQRIPKEVDGLVFTRVVVPTDKCQAMRDHFGRPNCFVVERKMPPRVG